MVERIAVESLRLFCPKLADELVWRGGPEAPAVRFEKFAVRFEKFTDTKLELN